MYIIKNALKNVRRNKGRNILLGAIIFTIITTTAVTLIISNAGRSIIDDYQSSFKSRVNISMNEEKLFENLDYVRTFGMPTLTPIQSITLAKSYYVVSHEMTASKRAISTNLISIDEMDEYELQNIMMGVGHGGNRMGGFISPDFGILSFQIYGGNFDEFYIGLRELIDGSFPIYYGEALISMELAEINNLKVGDEITLYSLVDIEGYVNKFEMNFKISGIYFDMTEPNPLSDFMRAPFLNRRNEILTTFETAVSILYYDETAVLIDSVYYLGDPLYLQNFKEEARFLGVSSLLEITTNEDYFYNMLRPILGLRNVTFTFMIITLIFGAIVLILLCSVAIRERKYEIGVLRAIGMKKHKIILGLWLEIVIITTICLFLGLGASILIAQPISDSLLSSQLESTILESGVSNPLGVGGGFGGHSIFEEAYVIQVSELDVFISIESAFQIVIISLLLTSIAGFISILKITKYEPIKILMERN